MFIFFIERQYSLEMSDDKKMNVNLKKWSRLYYAQPLNNCIFTACKSTNKPSCLYGIYHSNTKNELSQIDNLSQKVISSCS